MKAVFFLLAIVVVILIVRTITKNRNSRESKISAFEHPSTFKKPPIEMITKEPSKKVSLDKGENELGEAYNISKED